MKKLLLIGIIIALLVAVQLKRMIYEPGSLPEETAKTSAFVWKAEFSD